MDFGRTVVNLLEKNNMSQKALAERLKIAPTTLNGYIKNKHEPDYSTLVAIADIFGVTVDHLLGRSSPENAPEKQLAKRIAALEAEQREIISGLVDIMIKQNERARAAKRRR